MLNFEDVPLLSTITKQSILDRWDEASIFQAFFPEPIEHKRTYKNPLREDSNPGCTFFTKSGKILFRDWATGKTYNVFSFIMESERVDFKTALQLIERRMSSGRIQRPQKLPEESHQCKIKIEVKDYTDEELSYWYDYDISLEELQKEEIYSVNQFWVDNAKFRKDKICYAYYYREIDRTKILQPYAPRKYKWRSDVPLTYMEGLTQLPKLSDTVLVTKSKKDKMILSKIHSDVCASQNESTGAFSKKTTDYLNKHYKYKLCFFDNDEPGKAANMALNAQGYGWVNLDNFYYRLGVKDPSDYVKRYKDYDYLTELIETKIKLMHG